MAELLLASTNPGKIKEFQALLKNKEIKLVTPKQLGLDIQVEETGTTYADNARLKGLAFMRASGLVTMADDTGLEVFALDGAPGVRSARFSPKPAATDADRRNFLLESLKEEQRPWLARFRCVIALVTPQEDSHFSKGICVGEIIPQEIGKRGFGYDPIFFIPEFGRTMAQLSMEDKNRVSHRAHAVRAAQNTILSLLNST
ncbi:RdgB/HAM1 family non-canonical purine NTP pyrophosphatase [Chloroflexota bacterium]